LEKKTNQTQSPFRSSSSFYVKRKQTKQFISMKIKLNGLKSLDKFKLVEVVIEK
jgi:hypothetical protein